MLYLVQSLARWETCVAFLRYSRFFLVFWGVIYGVWCVHYTISTARSIAEAAALKAAQTTAS
eukprot:1655597-Karenia_brevis.AAC.1